MTHDHTVISRASAGTPGRGASHGQGDTSPSPRGAGLRVSCHSDALSGAVGHSAGTNRLGGWRTTARGPGAFFRVHRGLYALCLAGALGTAGYAAAEARKAEPGRALAWWALAGLTTVQAAGMWWARRSAL